MNLDNSIVEHNKSVSLYIELTSGCNLRCPYCYNDSGNSTEHLSYSVLADQIKSVAAIYDCRVSLSGGEPLLYPWLFDLLLFLTENNISASIVSNGILVNSEFVEFLVNNHILISHFQVSLDGPNESINAFTRGKGHFDPAMNTISRLKQYGIPVHVNCVISGYNYKSIDDVIDLVIKYNVDLLNFSFVNDLGRAKDSNNTGLCISGEVKKEVMKKISDIKLSTKSSIDIRCPELNDSYCPLLNTDSHFLSPKIDSKGFVYACHVFEGSDYSIGSVYDQQLLTILNENYYAFAERVRVASRERNSTCNHCLFSGLCNGICPALYMMNTYDDNDNLDGLCNARKSRLINMVVEEEGR